MKAAPAAVDDMQDVQTEEAAIAAAAIEGEEQQKQRKKEELNKILSSVRQNFGKINVAPEFNEEDLVPVEMPDLDISGSEAEDDEAEEDGEEEEEEEAEGVKEEEGEQEAGSEPAAEESAVAGKKNSKQVLRELDDKIAKYKQFLARAKSKRFSAIRSVEFATKRFCVPYVSHSPISAILKKKFNYTCASHRHYWV